MSAELTGELKAILDGAAFAAIDDRAFLRITGPDAPRWLNGMVTNNIQALNPGEGNYSFLLNAQGRIGGDCTIYRDPEATEPTYLLQTDKAQIETIQTLLDKFIIMDDVELTPVDEPSHEFLLLGPQAVEVLKAIADRTLGDALSALGPLRLASYRLTPAQLTTPVAGLVPRFYLSANSATSTIFAETALEAGAIQISPSAREALRILEARPRYGTDIRNSETAKDLPQETNQTHALHFAKGCYLGQEIVERIRSRGQVHRQFTPFRLEGAPPTSFPTPLEVNGKPAGELTSAANITTTQGDLWIALGYARREFLEPRTPLAYANGQAHPRTPGQLT